MSHVTHISVSCHTHEWVIYTHKWVMGYIWKSSRHSCECVMSYMSASRHTCKRIPNRNRTGFVQNRFCTSHTQRVTICYVCDGHKLPHIRSYDFGPTLGIFFIFFSKTYLDTVWSQCHKWSHNQKCLAQTEQFLFLFSKKMVQTAVTYINTSYHTPEWVTSHNLHRSHAVGSGCWHMSESRHTYEWVMANIWMSIILLTHSYVVISFHSFIHMLAMTQSNVWRDSFSNVRMNSRCRMSINVVACWKMSHVIHMNESCHCTTAIHMNE